MTNILHIDSSILGDYSVSRALSADIVSKLMTLYAGASVVRRDLANDAAMHLSGAHLAVYQGGEIDGQLLGEDLAKGAGYMDELFAADIIVIGAPMYNLSIPSQLKGWIDRVTVAGRTFRYTEHGAEGLVKGKKVFVASARGGIYSAGSLVAAMDFQESYLLSALGLIGMTDVKVIRAEGLAINEETKVAAVEGAKAQIASLAA